MRLFRAIRAMLWMLLLIAFVVTMFSYMQSTGPGPKRASRETDNRRYEQHVHDELELIPLYAVPTPLPVQSHSQEDITITVGTSRTNPKSAETKETVTAVRTMTKVTAPKSKAISETITGLGLNPIEQPLHFDVQAGSTLPTKTGGQWENGNEFAKADLQFLPYATEIRTSVRKVKRSKKSRTKAHYIDRQRANSWQDTNRTTNFQANITSTTRLSTSNHEVRHIAFLKVHKAASSTVQNVMFRFGMRRKLSFVFTKDIVYYSKWPREQFDVLKPTRRNITDGKHDILCNHGIFNQSSFAKVLHNDSVYVGIVREPIQQFLSAVHFYSQTQWLTTDLSRVPGLDRVHTMIEHADRYDPYALSLTRNSMARDFGFGGLSRLWDIRQQEAYLEKLDSIFRVVLVAEHFDESLILMKRYLNWSLQDILYLPINVLKERTKLVNNVTASDLKLLQIRNKLDFRLYHHFLRRFWKQISEQPPDIQREIAHFKKVLGFVSGYCYGKVGAPLIIKRSKWNVKFMVNRQDCKYMALAELKFNKLLRRIQGSEIKTSAKPSTSRKVKHTAKSVGVKKKPERYSSEDGMES